MSDEQRAPAWKRILRRPLCWLDAHRLGYRRGSTTYENWQACAFCGRPAYNVKPYTILIGEAPSPPPEEQRDAQ